MTIEHAPIEERYLTSPDGLKLFVRIYRPAAAAGDERLPIVCLPGLSRNGRDFHQLALLLSRAPDAGRRVVCLDYRGRGHSDRAPDPAQYTVPVEAGDVIAICAALGIDRAIFIGTSRGGLILHVLAGLKPELIAGSVLNDIGPVVERAGLAQIRTYLSASPAPSSWGEAARILKQTHGQSFPVLGDDDWQDMAFAIYREIDGRIVPDFDPALLNPLRDLDLSQPLPDLWPQFDLLAKKPVLAIRGGLSMLLSAATHGEMRKRSPQVERRVVEGQGHTPLLHLDGLPEDITRFAGRIG